jgi:glycerol uptake facilitator-like aquaporin
MAPTLGRRLAAEVAGTALLVTTVVGAGVMATRLAGGNQALALLCDAAATGAILAVLITALAPVSGAHLNPAVTAAFALRGEMAWPEAAAYVAAEVAGAVAGAILAHAMFELPLVQIATTARAGPGQWLGEIVATAGLLFTVLACRGRAALPAAVGLFILAAYFFTSSTSFANPAVTIARSLTDTMTGIAPGDVPAFIVAEFAGGGLALAFANWLLPRGA